MMKTFKISKDEIQGLEPLAEGYKAVKWDLSTNGEKEFTYGKIGEDIVGTVWKSDGDIQECKWGLHFSKDPANVFNFYEPLGYNRYFKVKAYEKVIDTADGLKSVAQIIEFIEEYDIMGFVAEIKRFDRKGDAVSYSNAVRWSTAVNGSYGILNCEAVKNCIFCYKKDAIKYYIFNKKVLKDRFNEVYKKILKFNFRPEYMNWDEMKGNKEWWAFNFERLAINDNPWSSMPEEMLEYIKALPEFNENVFNKITGLEGQAEEYINADAIKEEKRLHNNKYEL